MSKFDAIIIGFGKGGKTLAAKLAKDGKTVALIEKSNQMYGGTCINVGCIPSKSLIHNAAYAKTIDSFEAKAAFYKKAIEEKRNLTATLRQKNYDKLNNLPNVSIISGVASFVSPNSVSVNGEIYEAEKIYINTGSTSIIPNIEGIKDNKHVFYSDSMMDLDKLPERLVIIGGGYIGLEFASMYANFGSNVTIIQNNDIFIGREDEDIALNIKENLEAQGVKIIFSANTERIDSDGTVHLMINNEHQSIKADAVLIAIGRKANIQDLNLEAAGVEVDMRGGIITNDKRQTNQKHIYALGDIVGGLQFTYISLDDYRIIANEDYDLSKRKNIPYSVFLDTPFSRVGINEKEAKEQGYAYRVVKMPTAMIPKAQVLKKTQGILKALIDTKRNKILGAMLVCEESYEIINIIKLAMDLNADYTILKNQVFTHPTMSEALNDLFSL